MLVGASGCSKGSHSNPDPEKQGSGKSTAPDPDLALLAALRSTKLALITDYDEAVAAFPVLGTRLNPFRNDHVGHLEALGGTAPTPTPAPPAQTLPTQTPHAQTPTPRTPTPRTSARPTPTGQAQAQASALARLAMAEHGAAASRPAQCQSAQDPELARLIAAIGGCEAAHEALLTPPVAARPSSGAA